jgi:hypothetical protein
MKTSTSSPKTLIDIKAHKAATSPFNDTPFPTEKQKKAGDYKKGHLTFLGLPISIENPTGSTRSGKDPSGTPWSITMQHHYGYIDNTKGADGEEIDVFIKNGISDFDGHIYVVYQNNEDGSFDEHKVVIGAGSPKDARNIYLSNYAKGWTGLGKLVRYSIEGFKNKFLPSFSPAETSTEISHMKRQTEIAAKKVPAENFTWMKYKGLKNKILTHTKRNGELVKARLATNDVYGYRYTKKKNVPQPIAQIVIKQDSMEYVYEILAKSFDTLVLKHSKPTVIPKALRTVDLMATEKAPSATELKTKTGGVAKKGTSVEVETPTKVVKTNKGTATTNSPKPKPNSIAWESEDKNKYIKVVGTEGAKVEYELYIKERGRFVRRGQLISDKGLTYALRSFKSMSDAMRDDGKTDDSEALRSEIKLLAKEFKIKQADINYFKNEVVEDPTNLEQLKKVIIAYGVFFKGIEELNGEPDKQETLQAFADYLADKIRWAKDSLQVVQTKANKLFSKYEEENWGYDEDTQDESDEDTQDEQGDEVDTENAIQEMTNAFGTQFKPKHIDSLQALADDYGIDLGEIVLDLTNLAEETNGSLAKALSIYRAKH